MALNREPPRLIPPGGFGIIPGDPLTREAATMPDTRMPDPQTIETLLTLAIDKLPELVKGLVGSVFSEDTGRAMGKAAAAFYRELKTGGVPDASALEMTRDYVRTFANLAAAAKGVKE